MQDKEYQGLDLNQLILVDRSAVETHRECARKRWLNRHFGGVGIVRKAKNIPLSTGGEIHRAVEYILRRWKSGDYDDRTGGTLDQAIQLAKEGYRKQIEDCGLYGKGTDTDFTQEFTYLEQKCLIEQLIRVWHLREFPRLTNRFDIVEVETEKIVPMDIVVGGKYLYYQSRADAILQDKENGDYLVYSLKSVKGFSGRMEKSYKHDEQGLSEIWATEEILRRVKEGIQVTLDGLESRIPFMPIREQKATRKYIEFIKAGRVPDKIMGVSFCFLVKGKRDEVKKAGKGTGIYRTASPLIRPYRKFSPSGVQYAHSYYFPSDKNESGWSRLGKGWEAFNLWEQDEIGLEEWIGILDRQEIQPECGDVLSQQVVTPLEYWRKEEELEEWIIGVKEQERGIYQKLEGPDHAEEDVDRLILAKDFPMERRSCHWPTDCEYLPYCYDSTVRESPFENPECEFTWRTPHHEPERLQKMERETE